MLSRLKYVTRDGSFIWMLWPDTSRVGCITSDVVVVGLLGFSPTAGMTGCVDLLGHFSFVPPLRRAFTFLWGLRVFCPCRSIFPSLLLFRGGGARDGW